ncbi:MAG: 3-keto-5-aminohexanoate cleavage protein [Gammaproteobacteria bacterium]|nr:3-keto-5-aminohexanoate cleavage protein [Gammaproteobacteria bacterium]
MMSDPTVIIVAPNGARKTHHDHPALPVSIEETVIEAAACYAAGATVLHAHVRGKQQQHALDASLYIELITELKQQLPELLVQITTEAVGIYTPSQQIACVKKVLPNMVSTALRELTANFTALELANQFYHWAVDANVHIQHIVYNIEELEKFLQLRDDGVIPEQHCCVLLVLGRYSTDAQSSRDDLKLFLNHDLQSFTWFTCAFGKQEQACVMAGIAAGGHARIGFENNFYLDNGEIAPNNAALVTNLKADIERSSGTVASSIQTRRILGLI